MNHSEGNRKILFVIPGLTAGGAERVLTLLAGQFVARGHRVDVTTTFGREHDFYALPQAVHRTCLELAGETSRLVDKVSGNFRRIAGLRRVIRASAPDVIISFLTETNVLVLLAALGLGIPVIVTEHIDPRHYPLGRPWKLLRRLTYRRAAWLVSCSAGVDAAFRWLPARRRAMIYDPVCIPASDAAASDRLPWDWPRTILSMGRLERQKGFDLLIDAFALVAADFPKWGLVILGEGSLRSELSAQIERLGLSRRIKLAGTTASPAATLGRGDLFVLSSRYEGFGLTLVEAMVCGLAVIATDCPSGPAEIVDSGYNGILIPSEDVSAMAKAMARLMSDDEERRRLGANARAVAQRFGIDTVMHSWEQTIDACLAVRPRRPRGGP